MKISTAKRDFLIEAYEEDVKRLKRAGLKDEAAIANKMIVLTKLRFEREKVKQKLREKRGRWIHPIR